MDIKKFFEIYSQLSLLEKRLVMAYISGILVNRQVLIMTIVECAKLMGKSPQFVRCGLKVGSFPFGVAVKMSSKWCYYINDNRLFIYLNGGF